MSSPLREAWLDVELQSADRDGGDPGKDRRIEWTYSIANLVRNDGVINFHPIRVEWSGLPIEEIPTMDNSNCASSAA